jgi:tape measure domain-containing protein
MANEVKLRLAIDGGAQVVAVGNQAAAAFDRFNYSVKQAAQQAGSAASNYLGASTSVARFVAENERAAAATERLTAGLSKVGVYAAATGALALVAQQLGKVIERSDQFAGLVFRLGLVSESTLQAAATQQKLFAIAQDTRTGVAQLSDVYVRLKQSTDGTGISQQRLLGITKTLAQTLTLSGGSAESAQAALIQLGQGLASGTLRGEELNSVMEQTPALAKAIAEGLGVTVGQLREMGAAGKITAQQIVQALEASAKSVETDFAKLPLTIGQAMTQIRNSVLQSTGVFDQANGLSRGFAEGISFLAQNMYVATAATTLLGGVLAGRLAGALAGAAQAHMVERAAQVAGTQAALANAEARTVAAAATLAQVRAAQGSLAVYATEAAATRALTAARVVHTEALAAQTVAQVALTRATSLGATALGLVGGPVGLVITALTAGAAAWQLWGGASEKAVQQSRDAIVDAGPDVLEQLDKENAALEKKIQLLKLSGVRLNEFTPGEEKRATLLQRYNELVSQTGQTEAEEVTRRELLRLTTESLAHAYESVTKNAKLKAEAEQVSGKWQERLLEIQMKLAGINPEYVKTLQDLAAARNADVISAREYASVVKGVIAGQNGSADAAKQFTKSLADQLVKAQAENATYGLNAAAIRRYEAAKLGVLGVSQATIDWLDRELSALARKKAVDDAAGESLKRAIAARKEYVADLDRGLDSAFKAVQALRDEEQALQIVADTNLSLAQAIEQVTIARLEEKLQSAETAEDREAISKLRAEIAARRELQDLTRRKELRGAADTLQQNTIAQSRAANETVAGFLNTNIGTDLAAGFDQASKSLATFVGGFQNLIDAQEAYTRARAAAGGDAEKLGAVERRNQLNQVAGYATLAGAAKGFFKEGTRGYKTLEAAERAFRAVELAMAIATFVRKNFLINAEVSAKLTGETVKNAAIEAGVGTELAADYIKGSSAAAVGVATQAQGDPYSAFFRMAAMAAAMAALGFAVSGGRGGGGVSAAARQATTGTGTVLGDASAKSDSVANAIKALHDTARIELQTQSGMLAALRNIEANIAGLGNLLVRGSGVTTGGNLGITTGTTQNLSASENRLISLVSFGLAGALIDKITGGLVGKLVGGLFGSKSSSITDAGLAIRGSVGELMSGSGVQQYADVSTTRRALFGLSKSTSNSTQFGGVDAQVAQQFGLVFQSIGSTLAEAAKALGKDGQTVGEAVARFVVDIPRLSLLGLKGDDLQSAINNAISATADNVARSVFGGLEAFQKIGEGYFETITRVAAGIDSAQYALEKLGVSAIAYSDIINKQGDVTAELVRQSLIAYESTSGALSSVGKLVATLDGTGDDLAATYARLVELRGALMSVGASGDSLSAAMIRGAGGLDTLKDALSTYLQEFFTDSERNAAATARLAEQFTKLGLAVPATRAEFRALVQSLDTTTEAGQRQYAALVNLSGAFAEITKQADDLSSAGQGIVAFIAELRGEIDRTGASTLQSARAAYNLDLALAQGGDAAASGRITGSARSLIDAVRATATDPIQLARETARIATQLEALPATISWQDQVLTALAQLKGALAGNGPLATAIGAALGEARATITLTLNSALPEDLRNLALSGITEVNRLVRFVADTTSLPVDLRALAAQTSSTLLVTVRAALDASVNEDVRRLVLTDTHTISAVVNAGFAAGLPPDVLRVLTQNASDFAVTVQGVLASTLDPRIQTLLLSANTTAARAVQMSASLSSALTDDQRTLLLAANENVQKVVAATLQSGTLTDDQRLLLTQESQTVSRVLQQTVNSAGLTADQRAILNAITGTSTQTLTINANIVLSNGQTLTFDASDPLKSIFDATRVSAQAQLDLLQRVANGNLGLYVSLARNQNADGAMDIGTNYIKAWANWGGPFPLVRVAGGGYGLNASAGLGDVTAQALGAAAGRALGAGADDGLLASVLAELQALRAEVAAMRGERLADGAATAANTGKAARLLDRMAPDGDAFAVRIVT